VLLGTPVAAGTAREPHESLTTIGANAFNEAHALTSLDGLPSKVTSIEDRAFSAFSCCDKLVSIGPGFSPDCDVHPEAFIWNEALYGFTPPLRPRASTPT